MADPDYASLGRLLFGFKPEEPLEEPLKEPQDLIGAQPLITEQSPLDTGASLFKATEQTAPLTDASSSSALDTVIEKPKTADTVTGAIGSDTITGAAPDTGLADRFYDPMLKSNWDRESVADFGLQNDPRFAGSNEFYIDPNTGKYVSRTDYLATANTPEAVAYRNEQARIAAANAKLFRPGNTLTSGFGNVTEQLGGSGYYKGVAIPKFYEQSLGDAGSLSVADQLAQWKANIDKQDLSANAPFGFVETPVYTQPTGDYDPYVSGYKSTPATAFDYLTQNNPNIANAVLGHTSTGAFAYKVVNGELKEVGHDEITPEDIAQGNAFFLLAGATGGPNRQRMSQLYRADGNDLIPVGDPKMYQGAKEQDMGLAFLDMAASALAFVPGPWQVPAAIYKAGRAIDQGDWAQAALAAIPVIGDFANAAAVASEAAQVAGAVESASFANDIVNAVSSAVPSLDSVGKVTNALQQSVSALKAIDDKNWLGLVASGTGLAGATGAIDPNTAGLIRSTANLANVLNNNGSPAQIIAAATALANNQGFVDRATTDQVNAVASIIAAKDNPAALMGAVAQAARSGVFNETAKIGAQYEQLNNRGVIDEYNVTGGGGALISSGNPTEDEQIRIQQRQNAANQALTDYMGSGNDLSREGLVSQLQSLGLTADQAEGYAQQADQKINMNRVGADVMYRYSKIDPEFGTPQLDRDTAVQEMVAAGFTSDRANEILNGIDAQNAIKLENKLSVQSAYNNYTSGKGTEEQLRSALTSAGYTDAEINNLVTRGNAVLEGKRLTSGEQAQERAANLPDIRAEIAGKSSFNEAYALAREKLGAGATFTWQGKDYVASSAAERPDLSGKPTDYSAAGASLFKTPAADISSYGTPYVAPSGMHNRASFIQAGGGTSDEDYAKYVRAVNALIAEGKSGALITPASVNSTGKEMPSTTGPVTMEKPKVDSVLGSVVAQGVASFGANSIAGVLNSLGFTDAGKTVLDKANQIAAAATAAEGADITKGKADINAAIKKVGESSGIKDFAINVGNLASTAFNNPKAFGATVGSEVVEELFQFATLKFPASFLVKETVASALENAGAAYNTEYESQIAKGASKEDAHQAAQKAAGTAAGVSVALGGAAAGLGKVAGKVIGSQADEVPTSGVGQVGKTTLKESAQETVEEGSIAGAIDLALGRPVDAVNVLTNMTGGALYGGPTSGVMQATKLDSLDQQSTFIGSGLGADSASVNQAINNLQSVFGTDGAANYVGNLIGSDNLAAGGQTLASNLANVMGSDAAVTTANTLVGNLAISKVSDTLQSAGIDLENLSTVVGKTDAGNDITLGDALGASITGNGQSVSASTVVGLKPNGSDLTLGELASAIKTGNVSQVTTDFAETGKSLFGSGQDTATSGAVTTDVTGSTATTGTATDTTGVVTAETGATTGAATGATSGVDTATGASTSTDPATGVITSTSTDEATGVKTVKEVDPVTGESTVITSDETAGIVTKETIDSNESSTTTVDSNNNITTNTTVNTNTNTTTNITVNTNTGEVVVKVTNSGTGEVLDTQIKTVDELTPSELEKLTITDPATKTSVTKKPVTKPPVATAPKPGSSAGFSMFGEIGRLGTPMLKSAGDTQIKNPLEKLFQSVDVMNQIDPALLAVMTQRLNIQPEQAPTFTYGQETSIDDILGLREPKKPEEALYAEGGYVEPLRAKPMNLQFMNRGGALPGGREDFKDGKHVAGDGDGQSDDIPAWLADGEFVFPADVVSALGNGSTKAGTDKLYKMMHEIRARARSTKVKDLPPPAHKSPLDYIKKGK
jgi:hypothetical protein